MGIKPLKFNQLPSRPSTYGGRFQAFLLVLLSLLMTTNVSTPSYGTEETYQAPQAFIANAFNGEAPKPKVLWLTPALQDDISKIMGHRLSALRLRYWKKNDKTAWILEEIGKEQPITAGFVVEAGKIQEVNVLVYRETRGWEIKYPAFRNQFFGVSLEPDSTLDQSIDGISGATLSVRAMTKMARLALFLHGYEMEKAK